MFGTARIVFVDGWFRVVTTAGYLCSVRTGKSETHRITRAYGYAVHAKDGWGFGFRNAAVHHARAAGWKVLA